MHLCDGREVGGWLWAVGERGGGGGGGANPLTPPTNSLSMSVETEERTINHDELKIDCLVPS